MKSPIAAVMIAGLLAAGGLPLSPVAIGHAAPAATPGQRVPDTPPRPLTDAQRHIEENIDDWLGRHDVPAAAIAYIEDGERVWSGVYGEQSPGVPATSETLFNIASMTKSITAETILRMASKNEIDLDEPMSAYWIDPDIVDDPRHARLTPKIALTHRTGFPNWRGETGLEFLFEPDEKASYSGEGYNYVAQFAAQKWGVDFSDLVQSNVFGPLGMADASYIERDWFVGRVATPQGPDGATGRPDVRKQWNAADDIHITIDDYTKFIISAMKNENLTAEIAEQRLFLVDNFFANGCPWGPAGCPNRGGFAMGWAVFEYDNETVVMQGGGDWGERTLGFFAPDDGVGIVIFTNGANGGAIINEVVQTLRPESAFLAFLEFQAR